MTLFIPGLKLSRLFYEEAVRPVLERHFAHLRYSAALIGHGSEVLGYDTERSTDHHWGPRVELFLSTRDHARYSRQIADGLSRELPVSFRGYSTNWGSPGAKGVQLLQAVKRGPVSHRVDLVTVKGFVEREMHFDPYADVDVLDWLTLPQQELLCLTSGEVFYDGLGELEKVREKFRYYPHDVWLFLIASQWMNIGNEEAFPGRCAEAGDDLGSHILAARLVGELMSLCFMFEKKYMPYRKWLGTAFGRLECGPALAPLFGAVLAAGKWPEREDTLCRAYEAVARLHNALGITEPLSPEVRQFYGRPYMVLNAERFARATMAAIKDPRLRALGPGMGSVDQFDGSDATTDPRLARRLRGLYQTRPSGV